MYELAKVKTIVLSLQFQRYHNTISLVSIIELYISNRDHYKLFYQTPVELCLVAMHFLY